ncbi:DUF4352 domain-containing protein [Streptosporangium lutulentum]|uniref:DUF4352 domain-containing protein n=1 Tax=Streptosporangium lutulentum TaxID=1461250 RepID=A0ABT9Q678_9ACTN|nr:DUF4352 domain-containing protein [Streptosporangium lutulentum]MDP9842265.1 hypothetical protein [Streptosporangium lutulentum]
MFWLLIVCVPILLLFSCVATVVSIGGDTTVTTQEDRPGAVRSAAPESTQPSPVQEAESPAAAENTQPSPVQEAKPSAAAVGGAITLQGRDSGLQVAVTLVKVVENAKPKNDYSKPETGNRFFAVQLILNNTGQAAYSDSPTNGAYVIDAEGQQYSSAYGDVQEGVSFHGSVTMGAGDSRKGIIVFEVPQAAKISKFQFALNSGFADQKGEWLTQAAG